jgi:uncharacterized protein YdaT
MQNNILLYKNNDRWLVKKEGAKRASYGFDSKRDAEKKARSMASKKHGHLVFSKGQENDKIQREISFETDLKRINQHVLKVKHHWVVKGEGAKEATHRFSNKSNAVKKATQLARQLSTLLVVHNINGDVVQVQDLRGAPHPEVIENKHKESTSEFDAPEQRQQARTAFKKKKLAKKLSTRLKILPSDHNLNAKAEI